MERDTPLCGKCKGQTVLVSGYWNYTADREPYKNGIVEESPFNEGEHWLHGFICSECNTFHSAHCDD